MYIQYTTEVELDFLWDSTKNSKNYKKHGVWFEEAATVFSDLNALEIYDEFHSSEIEERYVLIGLATSLNLLVVVYCESNDFCIRIISARRANRWEVGSYEKKI